MRQENMAKWLKIIIIGVSICVGIVYAYIILVFGKDMKEFLPEYSSWYLPWSIFLSVTIIPVITALISFWKIVTEIGRDNSFSWINAKLLKRISKMAVIDSLYFLIGNVIFLILNINHPGILFASLMITFAGMAIAVAASALSHLVCKAAEIREENELTI